MHHPLTTLFFARKRHSLIRRLKRKVRENTRSAELHNDGSRAIYEEYGDRELRDQESGVCRALVNGKLSRVPFRTVRESYMSPVIREIERVAETTDRPVRVLEVGCGNGTNLVLLRESLECPVELAGIDISPSRIEVGKNYWKERLEGVQFKVTCATDLSAFESDQFDVVYSICALEQVTFRIHEVLVEMKRVARDSVVCVEPIYEYGNGTQRLYNIVNDQCRTLLSDMRSCGLGVEEHGVMPILHNPLNPVGLVVGRKAA